MSLSFIISDQQRHSQPLPQTSQLHLTLVMYSVNSIPYALSLTGSFLVLYSSLFLNVWTKQDVALEIPYLALGMALGVREVNHDLHVFYI